MAQAIGVLATIKNVKFVVHLFILREVLKIVNILSVQLQAKSATLGKSASLVKGIISTLENNQELKRSRKEPRYLQDFDVTTVTGSDDDLIRTKDIATSIENLMEMDFEGSSFLIDHYKDVLKVNTEDLKCEMTVFKNILNGNTEYEYFKEHLTQQVFPNLFKLVQVAITLPVSSSTCERSFSAMRRINTYLRSTMSQNRFNELGILNIEKDIVVDVEDILNEFSKTERRIKLM
ncbi:unnamed protein product [Macrosiphum euphorbiae]|uniref:HAT C-terminal dimerisation domain-containing protein n=1 Tax=Macrosiphum euphorbiae TaxID=13131 RepID=A0AAV0W4W3_9HEMI|nr:unnamed protein product [Macrosiphum euphorbiae]